MSETVVVVRSTPGGVDQYGDPVPGTETRTDVAGCAIAPRSSAENDTQGRRGVIVGLAVYTPPGVDIRPSDRLEVRGVVHEVEGEPGVWVSPYTGTERGLEVAVRRVEG